MQPTNVISTRVKLAFVARMRFRLFVPWIPLMLSQNATCFPTHRGLTNAVLK